MALTSEEIAEKHNLGDSCRLFTIHLEKTVFDRWREIRVAEGLVTDSQIACLLLQRYNKEGQEVCHCHVKCLHCHNSLVVPFVCGACQVHPPLTAVADSLPRAVDSQISNAYGQQNDDENQTEKNVFLVNNVKTDNETAPLEAEKFGQCKKNTESSQTDFIEADYRRHAGAKSCFMEPYLPDITKSSNSHTNLKAYPKNESQFFNVVKKWHKFEPYEKVCSSLNTFSLHNEKDHDVMYRIIKRKEVRHFECKNCGKFFPTRSRLELHNVVHSKEMPHSCDICKKQFKLLSALHVHQINIHSNIKPFKCDQCKASYAFNAHLNIHKRMHKEDRPFVCSDCGSSYKKSSHLSGHRKRVHKCRKQSRSLESFRCEVCEKLFKFRSSWRLHQRSHLKKSEVCLLCKIACKDKKELEKHMRGHDTHYFCSNCDRSFADEQQLQKHTLLPCVEKPFACNLCEKKFKIKTSLYVHRRAEHQHSFQNDERYKCEQCDSSFKYKTELTKHKSSHKDESPYVCQECGVKFKKIAHLHRHINSHEDIRSAVCHVCGKCCKGLKYLAKHIKMRHDIEHMIEKPYKCLECTASFLLLSQLSLHRGVHKQHCPFMCDHCGRAFRTEHTLTVHVRRHTGERPFKCSKCQEAFIDRCGLKRHEIQHTQSRELCHVCGANFPTKAHLAVHIQRHGTERPYKCSQCGKGYKTTSDLNKHMMLHSDDKPFQCSHCSYATHTKAMLNKHLRKHTGERPYKCGQCESTFAYFSSFAAHKKLHSNNRPFICDVCKAAFFTAYNLRLHYRKHSGERPYHCHFCPESFSWHSGLKCHLKKHQPDTEI